MAELTNAQVAILASALFHGGADAAGRWDSELTTTADKALEWLKKQSVLPPRPGQ